MSHRGLAKLVEEAGEVIQIAGKKLAYFEEDDHPDNKGSLKERLEDEIADFMGIASFVIKEWQLDGNRIYQRAATKLKQYEEWNKED